MKHADLIRKTNNFLGISAFWQDLLQLFKAVFSFKYIDLVLILILFYCIAQQELYYMRNGTNYMDFYKWERYLIPVAVENFALFCIPLVFLKRWMFTLYVSIFLPVFFVPALIQTFLSKYYGLVLDASVFHIIVGSSLSETFEYMKNLPFLFYVTAIFFLILMFGLCTLSVFCSKKRINVPENRFVAVLLLLPTIYIVVLAARLGADRCCMLSRTSGIQALCRGFDQGIKQTSTWRNLAENAVLPEKMDHQSTDSDILGVVVIGESATRSRLSLYGYKRETCPRLQTIKNDLILFSHAVCKSTGTTEAIHSIFSLEQDVSPFYHFYLPALLKKDGFQQKLFSMQDAWSKWDSTKFVFSCLDQKIYQPGDSENQYDENLIPLIQQEINGKNADARTIIFLHLNGSHVPFRIRVPETEKYFSKEMTDNPVVDHLNEYDDSIRYTDKNIGDVIELLKQSKRPAFLLYFSDHGESVYDDMTEAATRIIRDPKAPECYEVPLILWTNQEFRSKYPDIWRYGKAHEEKAFCTDTLIWSMLSLCNISFHGFEKEKDLFSDKYQSQENRLPYQYWRALKKASGR